MNDQHKLAIEESQLIVEEKVVRADGETTTRKYVKGRFLGKASLIHVSF